MDQYCVRTDGRWSGGGSVVLANLDRLGHEHPSLVGCSPMSAVLLPRNFSTDVRLLSSGRFVLLPQNAWAWHGPTSSPAERSRRLGLRVLSEVFRQRATAVVRLSSAIPDRPGRPSTILPNVLDEAFESVATEQSDIPAAAHGSFTCVSYAMGYKNFGRLVEGYRLYRSNGGTRRLYLRVSSGDPRVLRRLVAQIDPLPIDLDQRPCGRAEAVAIARAAHASIHPSLVEASPIALLEAAAVGTSVIASAIPGHIETAEANSFAPTLFDPLVPAAIADALTRTDHAAGSADTPITSIAGRAALRDVWIDELASFLGSLDA